MLVHIKSRLNEIGIQTLVGYSCFDLDKLDETIKLYQTDPELELHGYESEGEIIGIIGFRKNKDNELAITHLAVKPEFRGAGFGRGQILEVIALMNPAALIAETDEEAVDFYRAIGFEIESLGEKFPSGERFKCTYVTEENEVNRQ